MDEQAFYKKLCTVIYAKPFLQRVLPVFFSHDLDWDRFTILPHVFHDEATLPIIHTLVYRVTTWNAHEKYVLVIMGDQNAVNEPLLRVTERLMAQVMVCYRNEEAPKPFPFVYPLMLHTGKAPCTRLHEDRHLDEQRLMQAILEALFKEAHEADLVLH